MKNTSQLETVKREPESRIDKRRMIYCATCGEQSGGRRTSFWGFVHKWGPTTHKFKPTNRKPLNLYNSLQHEKK